jgi:hypothetical protein
MYIIKISVLVISISVAGPAYAEVKQVEFADFTWWQILIAWLAMTTGANLGWKLHNYINESTMSVLHKTRLELARDRIITTVFGALIAGAGVYVFFSKYY